ncbi:MAG: HAD-IIB family hydrolase [Actinobacteria bacterium]|nr:HAD-IIB family hydrolase [Actinomycetota bacterium]
MTPTVAGNIHGMGITAPIVVVTDLDGTLLDHNTYEAGPAAAALQTLQDAGVTIVCCSAKTRAEQQVHRRDLAIAGPFVVENGAAVHADHGPVRVLGLDYGEVRDRLAGVAASLDVSLRGFGDMEIVEVVERTGLSAGAAARAQERDHTEPFVVDGDGVNEPTLRGALHDRGLGLQRGARFWTAGGFHDKGDAVAVLRELYTVERGERPLMYGLGDTYNDAAMLAAVDVPMLVQRPDGGWADLAVDNLTRLDGIGPVGWCLGAEAILATASTA